MKNLPKHFNLNNTNNNKAQTINALYGKIV